MHIANHHGWIKPTIYQGLYNTIERNVEVEYVSPDRQRGQVDMMALQTLALPEALWDPILRLQSTCVRGQPVQSIVLSLICESTRSGALTGRILTEADIKEPGGRWDPNVSIIAQSLHKNFTPMLPALRELKDALVCAH